MKSEMSKEIEGDERRKRTVVYRARERLRHAQEECERLKGQQGHHRRRCTEPFEMRCGGRELRERGGMSGEEGMKCGDGDWIGFRFIRWIRQCGVG